MAAREDDERGDDLGALRVVLADDRGLGDGRVLDQRGLDLERPDAVGRGGDHVVVAALEPEVAVAVAPRLVARVVPAVAERPGVRVRVPVVSAEQADRGRVGDLHGDRADHVVGRRPAVLAEHVDRPARDRGAHRPRPHRHAAVVGDQERGLGLPVAVVHGQAAGALLPGADDLRVQRLAGAGAVPQDGQVVLGEVGLHEQPVERRRGAERGDPRLADDVQDRVGVGLAERDLDDRRPLVPLAEEPAPGGLRPARVGDRPVPVARPQVVPEARRRHVPEPVVLGVEHHLRIAHRAAGEEEDERVVGRGGGGLERDVIVPRRPARRGPASRRARRRPRRSAAAATAAPPRSPSTFPTPLASVIAATLSADRMRYEMSRLGELVGARHRHGADADRAEHRGIPGRRARQHHEDRVALGDAVGEQAPGHPPGVRRELGDGVLGQRLAQPARATRARGRPAPALPTPRRCPPPG